MTRKRHKLSVTDMHPSGAGVAQHPGLGRVYIPFAFPGEEVEVELLDEVRRGQWNAVRISPFADYCSVAGRCGGCLWPGADYSEQLVWKHRLLTRALHNFPSLASLPVAVHASSKVAGVRNRLHLHANFFEKRFDFGFYARGSKTLIAIEDCPMAQEPIRRVVRAMHALRSHVFPIDLNFGFGIELIHFAAGEQRGVQMVLYASASRHAALRVVLDQFGSLPCLQVIIREPAVEGDLKLWQKVNGIELYTRPGCFQQGNSEQSSVIRGLIAGRIAAMHCKILFDLYSGSGNYSLPFTREVTQIFGCDDSATGIAVAATNIERNKIGNARYTCGNTADVLKNRSGFDWPDRADLVILDPARFGIDKEVPALVAQVAPQECILISNNLTALAKTAAHFWQRVLHR